jgi:outer membrane protein assembly factor BamB/type 1 glutamine amidotransferase/plastocyanin
MGGSARSRLRHGVVLGLAALCVSAVTPAPAPPGQGLSAAGHGASSPGHEVSPPRVLVFTGTYGFRHDGIQEAAAEIQRQAAETGRFTVEVSGDAAVLSPETYRRVDAILLLQTTGLGGSNSPLDDQDRADFMSFADCGGGIIGIHAAADSGGGWPEFDALLGSYGFDSHPHYSLEARNNPLGRDFFNPAVATDVYIQIEDPDHPTTRPWQGFDRFRLTDEIYRWEGDPREDPRLHVLLSLDAESHYWRSDLGDIPEGGGMVPSIPNPIPNPVNQLPPTALPDDNPLAWVKTHGDHDARVFYTNLGHNIATWERSDFRGHVRAGIEWVTAQRPDRHCTGRIGEEPTSAPPGPSGPPSTPAPPVTPPVTRPPGAASSGPCSQPMPGGEWAHYGQGLLGQQHQTAEQVIGVDTVGSLQPVWETGDTGYQSPAPIVSGGCVFINQGGRIVAYDLQSGEVVWESSGADTSGTFAVTVVDGRVHVGLSSGGFPRAAAFDVTDGSLLWISDEIAFGYPTTQQASAVVHNGIQVLFTTGPDFDPDSRQGYGLIDAATGEILHAQMTVPEQDVEAGHSGGGAWGTPTVDPETNHLYVGTANPNSKTREHAYDNAILRIDLDRTRSTFGQVVGSYKGTPDSITGYDNPVCQSLGDTLWVNLGMYGSSPLCGQLDLDFGVGPTLWRNAEGRLLGAATQKSGVLHVFDATTMEPVWSRQLFVTLSFLGGNLARIATDGETLYVAANPGVLYAIDANDFSDRWQAPLPGVPMKGGNVALANGVVYYVNEDALHAYGAADGRLLWRSPVTPSASIGSGVAVAGNHVVANHFGNIVAYRLGTDGGPGGGDGGGVPLPAVPAGVPIVTVPGAEGLGYTPSTVLVPQGFGATYANFDPVPHDVVARERGADGQPLFRSELIGLGAVTPVTGVEGLSPGSYEFYCSLHPAMIGTLQVEASASAG